MDTRKKPDNRIRNYKALEKAINKAETNYQGSTVFIKAKTEEKTKSIFDRITKIYDKIENLKRDLNRQKSILERMPEAAIFNESKQRIEINLNVTTSNEETWATLLDLLLDKKNRNKKENKDKKEKKYKASDIVYSDFFNSESYKTFEEKFDCEKYEVKLNLGDDHYSYSYVSMFTIKTKVLLKHPYLKDLSSTKPYLHFLLKKPDNFEEMAKSEKEKILKDRWKATIADLCARKNKAQRTKLGDSNETQTEKHERHIQIIEQFLKKSKEEFDQDKKIVKVKFSATLYIEEMKNVNVKLRQLAKEQKFFFKVKTDSTEDYLILTFNYSALFAREPNSDLSEVWSKDKLKLSEHIAEVLLNVKAAPSKKNKPQKKMAKQKKAAEKASDEELQDISSSSLNKNESPEASMELKNFTDYEGKPLVFLVQEKEEAERLERFVNKRPQQNKKDNIQNKKANITFKFNPEEKVIIAATPDLPGLGVYAATDFNDLHVPIMTYVGDDNFGGIQKASELTIKIGENNKTSGDYLLQIFVDNGKKACAVDAETNRGGASFCNQANKVNAYLKYDAKLKKVNVYLKRSIRFGEEIVLDYGKAFWSKSHPYKSRQASSLDQVFNKILTSFGIAPVPNIESMAAVKTLLEIIENANTSIRKSFLSGTEKEETKIEDVEILADEQRDYDKTVKCEQKYNFNQYPGCLFSKNLSPTPLEKKEVSDQFSNKTWVESRIDKKNEVEKIPCISHEMTSDDLLQVAASEEKAGFYSTAKICRVQAEKILQKEQEKYQCSTEEENIKKAWLKAAEQEELLGNYNTAKFCKEHAQRLNKKEEPPLKKHKSSLFQTSMQLQPDNLLPDSNIFNKKV